MQPTLNTARLTLRPFVLADAPIVHELAGDWSVADTTLTVPHPYPRGAAEEWISSHSPAFLASEQVVCAVQVRGTGCLIGTVGLRLHPGRDSGELAYWVGAPYRSQGYCTEASVALVQHAFTALKLNRVHASHFARNAASGRVLIKLGMQREGLLRQHVKRWGRYEDLVVYGLLRDEWRGGDPGSV
jgi:RimJ/RimL family protein N-acetyltransferase